MKLVHITHYDDFVQSDRPYYPEWDGEGILIANFSINDNGYSMSSKRRLVVTNVPLINAGIFVAMYNCVLSRYGTRERYFYFFGNWRCTWRDIGWDRQHDVVWSYLRNRERGVLWAEAMSPTRNIGGYQKRLEKWGWL